MYRKAILSLLIPLSFASVAQKKLPKFGEVSMEEMKMTTYEADSSAVAVILFDKGETYMDQEKVNLKRHVRIKILTKGGFEYADYSMRVERSYESVYKLKGSTYNLEGGTIVETKMDDKSIFKSKYNKDKDQIKFTLPNVREGSIIEYTYVRKAEANYVPDWQFQYDIPSIWSDYETSIPNEFSFRKDMQGYLMVTEHEEKNGGSYEHFVMKNVPAFKAEPYITTPEDYVSKVHFYISQYAAPGQLVRNFDQSWESIVKDHLAAPEFGGLLKGSGFLQKTVDDLTAGMTEPQKKLQAIYDYVKANVEWDEFTDRIPDHPFKKVLELKKGSSSEINMMLISMLRKAGLTAYPVFVSTRDNGMVRPGVNKAYQFNDLICVVILGEKKTLVDATDRDLPITSLPERCLNGSGLILMETGPDWIPLVSARSKKVVNVDLAVDESGELKGQVVITSDGIAGGNTRKTYKNLGEEKYLKSLLDGRSWEVSKSEFNNMTSSNEAAKEKHALMIRDYAQANGPVIYLNPFILDRIEENVFKSDKRQYPVDFACPFERLYMGKIAIPEGFTIEEMPKPKVIALPAGAGKYVYNIVQAGNVLSITSQFIIAKSVFLPEEYPFLKEFYNQVIAKQAEQIVLKKK